MIDLLYLLSVWIPRQDKAQIDTEHQHPLGSMLFGIKSDLIQLVANLISNPVVQQGMEDDDLFLLLDHICYDNLNPRTSISLFLSILCVMNMSLFLNIHSMCNDYVVILEYTFYV
jgi:hypothetical protein